MARMPNVLISKRYLLPLLLALTAVTSHAQIQTGATGLPTERDSFDRKKFWGLAALGSGIYGAATIGLHAAWYKDIPSTGFHFFDDWAEWRTMDKYGHAYTAYFEAELCFKGARWTGMPNKGATWVGAAAAFIMQGTVEMLDAYSVDWGFSIGDMAFNLVGIGLFTAQQLTWQEQRLRLKVSSNLSGYPSEVIRSQSGFGTTRIDERANDLFGSGPAERFLKDYNAQTVWVSTNLNDFWPRAGFPPWLNVALGFGAENLYGGFSNSWTKDGQRFSLSDNLYPRYSQWYLSSDLDLSRIPTRKKWVRTALSILNVFKIPGPALEYNSQRKLRWHWLYF